MKLGISLLWKLMLAFLLVAVTAAALVAVFIRLTSVDRLTNLILDRQRTNLQAVLTEYYQANGSWLGVEYYWPAIIERARQLSNIQDGGEVKQGGYAYRDWRSPFGLTDGQGMVIIPMQDLPAGSLVSRRVLLRGESITVDGAVVGVILTAQVEPRFSAEEAQFLRRTDIALLYGTLGALLVALVIGTFLASTLIQPLQALTQASQKIAEGKLEQQVPVESTDEIGQLATAFNRMSQEVARVNQQRKQMTADIAHDLRTPLTVISGYVESMRDGVLKPTPERLALIYQEIERLQNLVGDLRILSQADMGELPLHPQRIAPRSLLEHAAAPFQHPAARQNILLTVQAEEPLPDLWVDEARMMQVFGNLMANALRYTPQHGTITLSARKQRDMVALAVEDTGEGIAPEELPFIFDRLHRADKSRHSEGNESGLGLAIVKALVEAHGGSVSARSTLGHGTTVMVLLPHQPSEPVGDTSSKAALPR